MLVVPVLLLVLVLVVLVVVVVVLVVVIVVVVVVVVVVVIVVVVIVLLVIVVALLTVVLVVSCGTHSLWSQTGCTLLFSKVMCRPYRLLRDLLSSSVSSAHQSEPLN